jgi:hypothetical protein
MGEDTGTGAVAGTDTETEVVTVFAAGADGGIDTVTAVFTCRRTSASV